LKPVTPYEGPKPRRWNALIQWDPHLFPPTHGYYLLRDYRGIRRFVKTGNILQSNNPRQHNRKLQFAPEVSVKIIPRFDDPINADAWNNEYRRNVALNSHWQQRQFYEETRGKEKHQRLVVSSIALRELRRVALSVLSDHCRWLRTEWQRKKFRQSVVRSLVDHSHRVRWGWALKNRQDTFQEFVHEALAEGDDDDDVDGGQGDGDLEQEDDGDDQGDDNNEDVEGGEEEEVKVEEEVEQEEKEEELRMTEGRKKEEAAVEEEEEGEGKEVGFVVEVVVEFEVEVEEEEDRHDRAPPFPQRSTISPEVCVSGGTVWIGGLRRSARHQPSLGSVYEKGIRRSSRFL
jgi:hypothetical protein